MLPFLPFHHFLRFKPIKKHKRCYPKNQYEQNKKCIIKKFGFIDLTFNYSLKLLN